MRRGEYDEAELERQLDNRGFFFRFFGRWMRVISKEWQLYPVGVLFGLGFDTTTEVLFLGTTAFLALQHIPWYAIICLPVLFTAGMTIMDTTDCVFMNLAYGWAFFNPVRKVYYNLAITGLSVGICFLVGGIETLGLISNEVTGLRRPAASGASCATSTQHRRIRDRRAVHRDLDRRVADLAIRPDRGALGRVPAAASAAGARRNRLTIVRLGRSIG